MKIAVVSDSHGNYAGLKDLYIYLKNEENIRRFIHLGHNFHDVEKAHLPSIEGGFSEESTFFADLASIFIEENSPETRIRRIIQVSGMDEEEGKKGIAPIVEYAVLNGLITVIVHDIRNLTREDIQNGYIFLHGATHIPQVEIMSERLFINPGHFSLLEDSKPTYALIDIDAEKITTQLRYSDHSIKEEKVVKIKRSRKIGIR